LYAKIAIADLTSQPQPRLPPTPAKRGRASRAGGRHGAASPLGAAGSGRQARLAIGEPDRRLQRGSAWPRHRQGDAACGPGQRPGCGSNEVTACESVAAAQHGTMAVAAHRSEVELSG
jgi:hypothetical protein